MNKYILAGLFTLSSALAAPTAFAAPKKKSARADVEIGMSHAPEKALTKASKRKAKATATKRERKKAEKAPRVSKKRRAGQPPA